MDKAKVYYPGRKGYALAKREALEEPETALWWWRTLTSALAYEAEVMRDWLGYERNRSDTRRAAEAHVIYEELVRLRDEAECEWHVLKQRDPDTAATMEHRLDALITHWDAMSGPGSWFVAVDWPESAGFGHAQKL